MLAVARSPRSLVVLLAHVRNRSAPQCNSELVGYWGEATLPIASPCDVGQVRRRHIELVTLVSWDGRRLTNVPREDLPPARWHLGSRLPLAIRRKGGLGVKSGCVCVSGPIVWLCLCVYVSASVRVSISVSGSASVIVSVSVSVLFSDLVVTPRRGGLRYVWDGTCV